MVEAFGWFAAATSGARSAPQILRIRRAGTHAGVSAFSMAFTGLNAIAWVVWSTSNSNLPVLASSALTAAGFLEVARITRSALSRRETATLWAAMAIYAATFTLAGEGGLGILGAAGSTVQFIPQAIRALRTSGRTAVAPGTYMLSGMNELSWLIYATLSQEPLVAAPYLIRLPVTLTILASTLKANRTRLKREEPDAQAPPQAEK